MERPRESSLLVRMAVRVGATVGRWQRQRAARRDDALVEKWKSAWAEGCEARRAGIPQDKVPYRRSRRRAAWLAGWQWVEQQATSAGAESVAVGPIESTERERATGLRS